MAGVIRLTRQGFCKVKVVKRTVWAAKAAKAGPHRPRRPHRAAAVAAVLEAKAGPHRAAAVAAVLEGKAGPHRAAAAAAAAAKQEREVAGIVWMAKRNRVIRGLWGLKMLGCARVVLERVSVVCMKVVLAK